MSVALTCTSPATRTGRRGCCGEACSGCSSCPITSFSTRATTAARSAAPVCRATRFLRSGSNARMSAPVRLGLRANAGQFALLVALNALVGAMVGLERSVLPLVGKHDFGLRSTAAVLAFVVAFGAAKAVTNLVAGDLAERLGRKRILVAGWLVALPIPLLIALAPSWWWIVAANILLGVNQGLAWSMTVVMKIDLAGPARRGLALGLNEAAGYLVAAAYPLVWGAGQLLTGWLSDHTGRKPLIAGGMILQAGALGLLVAGDGSFAPSLTAAVLLGVGTAMVYPTLLAAVSDTVRPLERARAVGIYRFWRDFGFVAGALIAGIGADATSASAAIVVVAVLTAVSGLVVAATPWAGRTRLRPRPAD